MSSGSEKIATACTQCGKRFQVAREREGKRARCPCGNEFTIYAILVAPVARSAVAPAAAPTAVAPRTAAPSGPRVPAAGDCYQHAGEPATAACRACRRLICDTCDFPQNDGSHLCSQCIPLRGGEPTAGPFAAYAPPGRPGCEQHPDASTVAYCGQCRAAVCATCVFTFPGGLCLCPKCATQTKIKLSGTRMSLVVWSLVMAGWATLATVVLMSGALEGEMPEEAAELVVGLMILVPCVIGSGLAVGSLDRREGNPPLVWVTVVWNGVVCGAWLLLTVIGIFLE